LPPPLPRRDGWGACEGHEGDGAGGTVLMAEDEVDGLAEGLPGLLRPVLADPQAAWREGGSGRGGGKDDHRGTGARAWTGPTDPGATRKDPGSWGETDSVEWRRRPAWCEGCWRRTGIKGPPFTWLTRVSGGWRTEELEHLGEGGIRGLTLCQPPLTLRLRVLLEAAGEEERGGGWCSGCGKHWSVKTKPYFQSSCFKVFQHVVSQQ